MSLSTAYAIKKRAKGCASGGMVEQEGGDVVDRIMKQRMSKGGMVANDVGVAEADKLPAEYDYLVLNDDMEDTAGPGNEIGDASLDADSADVVARIMASRKRRA